MAALSQIVGGLVGEGICYIALTCQKATQSKLITRTHIRQKGGN